MSDRPVGTITYLFTDVEGSTRLWQQIRTVKVRHDALFTSAVEANGGTVVRPRGEVCSHTIRFNAELCKNIHRL